MTKRSAIALSCTGVGLLVLAGAVYAYDSARSDDIARSVKIGGVAVGGLNTEQARARLRDRLLDRLNGAVVISHGDRRFKLTSREAHISADLSGMIDEALARSRSGSIFTRTVRNLTDGEVDTNVPARITYSRAAVTRTVARVKRTIARSARDATLRFSGAGFTKVSERDGVSVDTPLLRKEITRELLKLGSDRKLRVRTYRVRPKVRESQLAASYPRLITVDRANFKLHLFKNLKEWKTYGIAVGRAGLETPAGLYHIQERQVNPSWHVPTSKWAGKLAGKVIPPGPKNPIKARWMGLAAGVGIHGTAESNSIGTAASHGCIRMKIPDVKDLFDRVETGTAVYVA